MTKQLDEEILSAIRNGSDTREKLMNISNLRVQTWSVVSDRLRALVKDRALIATKAGWRLAK
ncbi:MULTISPECIES: hypothetical protein [Herbaspirillum]|uniref:Uncharacterized protein n=2 Tax=Herbaspirillum huttiense TaxID=863372 RepID=A0AAJ2LW18_9BURK|nr:MULTISPECIES: hypothetical protein [Herbaspirillum]MDR9837078.1 hypothetical protein [Herbaspirillum huttiense]